jgi:hypothetical protein
MMLGEESSSATYWKKCGDEALKNGVKHVVMMVNRPLYSFGLDLLINYRVLTGQLLGTKSKSRQIQILGRALSPMFTPQNMSSTS